MKKTLTSIFILFVLFSSGQKFDQLTPYDTITGKDQIYIKKFGISNVGRIEMAHVKNYVGVGFGRFEQGLTNGGLGGGLNRGDMNIQLGSNNILFADDTSSPTISFNINPIGVTTLFSDSISIIGRSAFFGSDHIKFDDVDFAIKGSDISFGGNNSSIGNVWACTNDNGLGIWQSQWIKEGSNLYYEEGNVGIGTTNPLDILDVYSNVDSNFLKIKNTGNHSALNFNSYDVGEGRSFYLDMQAESYGMYAEYNSGTDHSTMQVGNGIRMNSTNGVTIENLAGSGNGIVTTDNSGQLNFTSPPEYPDNLTAVGDLGVGKLYFTDVSGEHILKITY